MKRQLGLGFLGILALLVGCSGGSGGDGTRSLKNQSAETSQEFSNPLVGQSARNHQASSVSSKSVPGLLKPTNAKARIPGIVTGRRDPFAVIPTSVPPIIVSSRRLTPQNGAIPGKGLISPKLPSAQALPPITLPPMAARPPVAPLPTIPLPNLPSSSGALPGVPIPNAPRVLPPSPTSLAEAIEVSGVVQVGSQWNVIVKEPNASSSRYVSVGDYLENGKVLVKKIVASGNSGATVVLQQNGVEVRKNVG